MFVHQSKSLSTRSRRGLTLLIVVTMLALFAIVAVGFVIYAQSAATASRYVRQSRMVPQPEMEAELLMSYFLGQLLYGASDDEIGALSGMRGHSLADNMFGRDPSQPNVHPYSGLGRAKFTPDQANLAATNDQLLINYTWFQKDGFVRDPGRLKSRASPSAPLPPYVIGQNPPYTYPDLNNLFLAAINADGEILRPSIHREETFGTLASTNGNWTNIIGKYLTLRPRPAEHPGIGFPDDLGGDVKNLPNAKGIPEIIGGVKTGKYYNNDSIWMDLGHPVMTAPDGTKFKPLFAPLIIDLDNKINLNVHGNHHHLYASAATYDDHFSHQGWGAWEVSLKHVLNQDPIEWKNILRGNALVDGRYGADKNPRSTGNLAGIGVDPHRHGQVDFDGHGPASSSYRLPLENTHLPYIAFPEFPVFPPPPNTPTDARYRNNDAGNFVPNTTKVESPNHPSIFGPLGPAGDDRLFSIGNMESILRYGDTNSPAHTSDLFQLCPKNFLFPKVRWQVTTLSMDLRWPGLTPWLDRSVASAYTLSAPINTGPFAGERNASGGPVKSPVLDPANPAGVPPNQGEFAGVYDPTSASPNVPIGVYRAAVAALKRVNINDNLARYPTPRSSDPANNDPKLARIDVSNATILANYKRALADRQQMAKEIFDRLLWVATGRHINDLPPRPAAAPNLEYEAIRHLAQLAVNIVDFRDEDDYITPFEWRPRVDPNDRPEFVYGTELPRIVLNEVYSELKGVPPIGPPLNDLDVNFWIELHNPFRTDPTLYDGGAARIQVLADPRGGPIDGPFSVYNIVILKSQNPCGIDMWFRDPANVTGDYKPARAANLRTQVDNFTGQPAQTNMPDPNLVLPVDQASVVPNWQGATGKNEGFFVIGPQVNFPDANVQSTLQLPSMTDPNFDYTKNRGLSFRMTVREYQAITQAGDLPTHTILLRRLANTHLPHEPNSASPLYNPYVTIDYIENIVTQSDQVRGDLPTQGGRFAQGRRQPFAAHVTQIKRQVSAGSTDRKHTMFRQNALVADPTKLNSVPATETLAYPFDWLVHPDRQIISPMELLQVSAYHPHELTQQFVISNGGTDSKFRHRADWFDEKQRLYRFFEMAETESRMSGVGGSVNEYVPGRINLNTIWDVETFSALCDAQGIRMTNAQVATMFAKMVSKRTPNQVPGPNDQPFRGAAEGMRPLTDGQLPGSGIKDTFLKDDLGTNTTTLRRMFGVPPMDPANETVFEKHPYRGAEMMTKIFSNTTTRSNVFAVWVTVGFFRVVDEKTRPVTLGAEIGRAENRHVRYRMFAIVDRTKIGAVSSFLTSFDTNEKVELTAAQMAAGITQPGLATVKLQATEGTRPAPSSNSRIPTGGFDWKIHPGQVVRISNTEVVTVRAVDHANKTITAFFTSEHKPSLFGAPTVSLNGIRAPGGILGHPGPQPDFDPRRFPDVVPYFTVIERIGG